MRRPLNKFLGISDTKFIFKNWCPVLFRQICKKYTIRMSQLLVYPFISMTIVVIVDFVTFKTCC